MGADKNSIEARFEQGLFASRWLMAPMYLGLVVSLGMLTVVFTKELVYYASKTFSMTADQGILAILTLIDLSLAANLLLIVLFSGYENFVSKLDLGDQRDRPSWMGKVDFSGVVKEVCLAYTPEVEVGQWVVVHVGFAISLIDEVEARKVFEYLEEIGELLDLQDEAVAQQASKREG